MVVNTHAGLTRFLTRFNQLRIHGPPTDTATRILWPTLAGSAGCLGAKDASVLGTSAALNAKTLGQKATFNFRQGHY